MIVEELKKIIKKNNKKELRKFAFTIGIVMIILAIVLMISQSNLHIYFLSFAILIILMAVIRPNLLKWFYFIWMSLALIIGYIMTRVILTLIYIIMFAPAGIVIRLLRKDPLKEKFIPEAKTYWIPKDKQVFLPENAEKQY